MYLHQPRIAEKCGDVQSSFRIPVYEHWGHIASARHLTFKRPRRTHGPMLNDFSHRRRVFQTTLVFLNGTWQPNKTTSWLSKRSLRWRTCLRRNASFGRFSGPSLSAIFPQQRRFLETLRQVGLHKAYASIDPQRVKEQQDDHDIHDNDIQRLRRTTRTTTRDHPNTTRTPAGNPIRKPPNQGQSPQVLAAWRDSAARPRDFWIQEHAQNAIREVPARFRSTALGFEQPKPS